MLVSDVRRHAPERGPALHTAASSALSVMTGTSAFSRYCRMNEQGHGLGQVLSESTPVSNISMASLLCRVAASTI